MAIKKAYIGYDITDRAHMLKQSVCSMLNAAARYEEQAVPMYQNIYGQMDMAGINREIKDQLISMIPDENARRTKLIDIARKVGCEIYYE